MPRTTRSSQKASIQDIIDPIASFYSLLATFPYLPPTDILTPPPSGWPISDITNLHKLPKSDHVIEVLKHLPCIRTDHNRAWRLGDQDTLPIAYVEVEGAWDGAGFLLAHAELKEGKGKVDQEFLWKFGFEPYGERLGENVVALTNGMQYGSWLLLDVEAGTITDFSLLGGISSSIKSPPPDRSAGLSWKHFPSQPIKEFFQTWGEKYRSLEWMPIPDKDGRASGEIFSQKQMGQDSKAPAEIRKIYINHGWGSVDFRREECRIALRAWREAWGKKIVEEHDELMRKGRSLSPPDPLDEISD